MGPRVDAKENDDDDESEDANVVEDEESKVATDVINFGMITREPNIVADSQIVYKKAKKLVNYKIDGGNSHSVSAHPHASSCTRFDDSEYIETEQSANTTRNMESNSSQKK